MNWSLAYDNSRAVAGSEHFLAQWQATAETFRQRQHASARLDLRYGEHARQAYDLFLPADGHARALLVHVHGGYWMRTDKSCWSHCAAGALAHGLAVALSTPTARAESPALLEPRADTHLYAWVGADELPELRRQTALLKLMWQGQLDTADATEAPGKHHFDVIDALEDPQSGMLQTLLAHC